MEEKTLEEKVKSFYKATPPLTKQKEREPLTLEILKSISKYGSLSVNDINMSLEDVRSIIGTSFSYKKNF